MNSNPSSDLAREVVRSLQAMMIAVETGVLDTYPALIVAANMALQDYIDSEHENDSIFLKYSRQILEDAQTAWRFIQNIPQTGTRFAGGGFGLGGFLLGAAISSGLNTVLDDAHTKSAKQEIEKAKALWGRASQLLDELKNYVRSGETGPLLNLSANPPLKPLSKLAKYGFFSWV